MTNLTSCNNIKIIMQESILKIRDNFSWVEHKEMIVKDVAFLAGMEYIQFLKT